MKKIALLVTFLITLAGLQFFEACQSAKSSTASKMMKFNLEKGKGYDYEMTMNLDQDIMSQKVQMDMMSYYSMDVKEDDGHVKTITTSIDRFKLNMGLMGANFEVDTDKPIPESGDSTDKKQKALQMMNKVFGAIKGKQFSMKVDAEGKVLDVTGFENIGQSIADSMGLPEEDRAEIMKALDKQFNSDQIKGEMQRFWYIFPNKEVKVGDSWAKNYDLGGALPGKYNSTYKVTDIEGDMVTLEEKTKIESKDEKMSLKGDVSGTIVVDSRSGLVVNADQDIKMTTEAGGMSFETKGKTKIKGKAR